MSLQITLPNHIREIRIIIALIQIEERQKELIKIQRERRELLEFPSTNQEKQRIKLEINRDRAEILRRSISESQWEHQEAVRESAERIAEGFPRIDQPIPLRLVTVPQDGELGDYQ